MRLLSRAQVKLPSLTLRTECLWYYPEHNPAEVTSKDKHRCCPCQKWADLFYSLTGLTDRFRYARVFFTTCQVFWSSSYQKNNVWFWKKISFEEEKSNFL